MTRLLRLLAVSAQNFGRISPWPEKRQGGRGGAWGEVGREESADFAQALVGRRRFTGYCRLRWLAANF